MNLNVLSIVLLSILLVGCASQRQPKVIFDTDMGNDVDDALALAILFKNEREGKLKLAAIAVNKDNPYAPRCVRAISDYYDFNGIPIGTVANGATREDGSFNKAVAEMSDSASQETNFPNATSMLRKILAESADGEIVYVSVGFSTNLAQLLESPPDEISALSGAELFKRKVKYVSMMAGEFDVSVRNPENPYVEYNVKMDIPSAKYAIDNCPVPIIFSGFEVGKAIEFPHSKIHSELDSKNPIVKAYDIYADMVNKKKGSVHNRPTWDLTSVLYVSEPELFELSPLGTVVVMDDGATVFSDSEYGNHRYMKITPQSAEEIKSRLVELVDEK